MTSSRLKVFPPADIFPMLPADELQELAVDIKANGLREPIVVASIDGEDMLVDGRNRLAACEIAAVEPAVRRLNGEDPTAFVVSANINRRHMTKGQRAMAVAMIHPETDKRGRGQKSKVLLDFSRPLLQQARTVLAHTPELAKQVLAAGMPLAEAYARATELKQQGESEGAKLERLRHAAPDLAELVDVGKIASTEAMAALDQREAQARAQEENKRQTLLRVSVNCTGIAAFANAEFVAGLKERLADEAFKSAFLSQVRPHNFDDLSAFLDGAKAFAGIIKTIKGE